MNMNEFTYSGFENHETSVHFVTDDTILEKKDIVMCKARRHYYLHLIHAIKDDGQMFLIGNNHGHMNGWVNRKHIYGKVHCSY